MAKYYFSSPYLFNGSLGKRFRKNEIEHWEDIVFQDMSPFNVKPFGLRKGMTILRKAIVFQMKTRLLN